MINETDKIRTFFECKKTLGSRADVKLVTRFLDGERETRDKL